MKDELGVLLHYEFALGVDMLAAKNGRRNSARKLLKFGGGESPEEVADKAWNAAWDIWFMRLPEGLTYGLLEGTVRQRAALITANKDPQYIRSVSEVRAIIDTGDRQFTFGLNTWDETIEFSDFLTSLVKFDPLEALRRSERDPEAMLRNVVSVVDSLERSIGVERRTVASYFDSGVAEIALNGRS